MSWTKEQALAAWRQSVEDEYDPDWDETICDILLDKVEISVVVRVLNIIHATAKFAEESQN